MKTKHIAGVIIEQKNKIKELLLDTPEKYWLVIFGYHIKKCFWGVLFLILGSTLIIFHSILLGLILLILGLLLAFLSIYGHIYTHNKPYFKLWDKMEKYDFVKKEIKQIIRNSDCADLMDRQKDAIHSKLTLEWVLKLKPSANQSLQIAALGHDIDRAIESRRVKNEDFDDYNKYKKRYAQESAVIVAEIMKKYDYNEKDINNVQFLIENHEVGGSEEVEVLKNADSLTFFSYDVYYYLQNRSPEMAIKKIEFMYNRLSDVAKKLVKKIEFKDKKIAGLVYTTIHK